MSWLEFDATQAAAAAAVSSGTAGAAAAASKRVSVSTSYTTTSSSTTSLARVLLVGFQSGLIRCFDSVYILSLSLSLFAANLPLSTDLWLRHPQSGTLLMCQLLHRDRIQRIRVLPVASASHTSLTLAMPSPALPALAPTDTSGYGHVLVVV